MTEQQRLSTAKAEWRGRHAVELHQAGWTGRAIAKALGVVPRAVSRWLRKAREDRGSRNKVPWLWHPLLDQYPKFL